MLILKYKDFNEFFFEINRLVLKHPDIAVSFMENTRAIVEDLYVVLESTNCDKIDLGALGYKQGKWTHLVRTYLGNCSELKKFYQKADTSKGNSIAFDFTRKDSGNGSCLREIILTRSTRKKTWQKAKILVRASEGQKRMAADLILIHRILERFQIEEITYYIAHFYQSCMYVIPLVDQVFGVSWDDIGTEAKTHQTLRYRKKKYYQPDSPPQKLSPARIMQLLHYDYKAGIKPKSITVESCKLPVV